MSSHSKKTGYALKYPLHRAVYDGDEKEVERLLNIEGIDVNVEVHNGVVPLLVAAFMGRENMVDLGSVQQSRLSSQFAFHCCNLPQLLNPQNNVLFHLNLHFNLHF